MRITPLPAGLRFSHPVCLIATGCGIGLLPLAPGTWGSLAALPTAWLITVLAGPWALLAASLVAFALGVWASGQYARTSGVKDSQSIVIDEIAGQWLALLAAPLDPLAYLGAFVMFRLCDIAKPWPANWADRNVPGGLGVMLDDVIAGAYALMVVHLALYSIKMYWN